MEKFWEKTYAKWFLKEIGFNYSKIHDSEQPDFIIESGCKVIGLEVTNIYKNEGEHGSIPKIEESKNNRWLKELCELYYRKNSQPINIRIYNYHDKDLPDPSSIIHDIENNLPNNEFDTRSFVLKKAPKTHLKIHITLLPTDLVNYNRWQFLNNYIGWSKEIGISELENKINIKKKKSDSYKDKVSETILIIVIDSSRYSGMLHLNNQNFDFSCKEFKDIYLVKYLFEVKKIG